MFGDFSDKDFALMLLSVDNYDKSCLDLVNLTKDRGVPLEIVSELVNLQRVEYGLYYVNHNSFKDLSLDIVVSGKEYFFNAEKLRLTLATLATMYKGGKDIDIDNICKIMREVRKFLSFKINYKYDISEYIETLKKFKSE